MMYKDGKNDIKNSLILKYKGIKAEKLTETTLLNRLFSVGRKMGEDFTV
jgi:hypothetical protein